MDGDLSQSQRQEKHLVDAIKRQVEKENIDNVSRTNAYLNIFLEHPEMKWSFLASQVSRNAGWNMCDLLGPWLPAILSEDTCRKLYFTYERANWLIFHDAYPQLLIYHYSLKAKRPLFALLDFFSVSSFMKKEWNRYWKTGDELRLVHALIINEQNVIEQPVMQDPFYKTKVFKTLLFTFEDRLHFSSVLFPTRAGELYGASVNGFRSLDKRIDLGKRLTEILFHKHLFTSFVEFAKATPHTGSRLDYEQYLVGVRSDTPTLRNSYPIIPHQKHDTQDWYNHTTVKEKWWDNQLLHLHPWNLTKWYLQKQEVLHKLVRLKSSITQIKI